MRREYHLLNVLAAALFVGLLSAAAQAGNKIFPGRKWEVGKEPRSVALADLNNDGWVEIVAANGSTCDVSVLLADQKGSFEAHREFQVGPGPSSVALADINHDGWIDIITSNWMVGDLSILYNRLGTGRLSRRGDVNVDGSLNISDAVTVLSYLFQGSHIACEDAADINDDGRVNIADPMYLLLYLFGGREKPPYPFPDCGTDPTADSIGCSAFDLCR